MALIRHQKQTLSAGLSWNQLTQNNYKAEAINLSEHEGRPFGAIYRVNGEDGKNSYLGLSNNKNELGNISAAAVFASICENGMIIDSISDKSAWWCASIGNQILTQTDKVYNKDDLTSDENGLIPFIDEALPQIIEEGLSDFKIYAAPDVAELIQDLVGEIQVITMTLSDLIAEYDGKFPRSFTKYRIKKITGTSPIILLGIAALMVGSGYYFFLYDPVVKSVEMDMGGLSSLKTSGEKIESFVKKESPSEKDLEILNLALIEEKQWLIDDLNSSSLKLILENVFSVYENAPVFSGGWRLSSIRYDKSVNKGIIVTQWHKEFGTPSDFRHYWNQVGLDYDIRMDGKTAEVYFPFVINPFIVGDHESLYRKYEADDFDLISLMSSLDEYQFNWTMNTKPEFSRRKNIENLYNKDLADVKQLPIKVVGFNIGGKGPASGYLSSIDIASKSHLVLADQIEINVTNGFEWVIKGEFYDVN